VKPSEPRTTGRRTVIRGGSVFDGTGALPARADVVISEGAIVDVGIGLDADEELDATGQTVLPGLIDCHVHVVSSGFDPIAMMQEPFSYQFYAAARNLQATLACGITTVRDAGGADLGVKRALEDGLIAGPDMLIAVTVLGQTGGHTDGWMPNGQVMNLLVPHPGRPPMIVDGPDEMRSRVRELIRAGADVIKVCTSGGVLSPRDDPRHAQFSPEELEVCLYEATAADLPVMAHAQGAQGIKNALRAGVRSIEHGIFLDEEAIELMIDREAWLVPTLLAARSLIDSADNGAELPQAVVDKARIVAQVHMDSVREAHEAGVRIAMGTDSGVFPHGSNLKELALMVNAGLSPREALMAATSNAARLLRRADEIGRIAPGFKANLTLVTGDALDFHCYRERISQVIFAGKPVPFRLHAGL